MFNTCRIPRSGKDVFYMYPSDSAGCNSILVIRKNRFYICDVADRDGKLISASQLEHQLETIKKMAESSQGSTLCSSVRRTRLFIISLRTFSSYYDENMNNHSNTYTRTLKHRYCSVRNSDDVGKRRLDDSTRSDLERRR